MATVFPDDPNINDTVDGKWRWTGTAWRPIHTPEPGLPGQAGAVGDEGPPGAAGASGGFRAGNQAGVFRFAAGYIMLGRNDRAIAHVPASGHGNGQYNLWNAGDIWHDGNWPSKWRISIHGEPLIGSQNGMPYFRCVDGGALAAVGWGDCCGGCPWWCCMSYIQWQIQTPTTWYTVGIS